MKKVYGTPTLVTSGSTVRETLVSSPIQGLESQFKRQVPTGGLGFYL